MGSTAIVSDTPSFWDDLFAAWLAADDQSESPDAVDYEPEVPPDAPDLL